MKKVLPILIGCILTIACTSQKEVVEQKKTETPKTALSLDNENNSKKTTVNKTAVVTPKVKSENDPPPDYKKTHTVAPVKLKNAPKANKH